MSLSGDEARKWLNENVNAIFELGTLPELTPQRDGPERAAGLRMAATFRAVFRRYQSSYLSFLDTAGESLGTQRAIEELKFLTSVDAFILMLDPFTLPEAGRRLALPESAPTAGLYAHSTSCPR